MKTKNGKVKLERRDLRLGNFVFTDEKGAISLSDIGGLMKIRLNEELTSAKIIKIFMESAKGGDESASNALAAYATVMYNLISSSPFHRTQEDGFNFLVELNNLVVRCVNVNKDLYGLKEDISLEEDNEIVEDLKGVNEFEEKIDEAL